MIKKIVDYLGLYNTFGRACFVVVIVTFLFLVGPITLPKVTRYPLTGISIVVAVFYIFKLRRMRNPLLCNMDKDIKNALYFFVAWGVITGLRGLFSDLSFRGIVLLFSNPKTLWIYFVPMIGFVLINGQRLKILYRNWTFAVIISFVIVVVFNKVLFVDNLNDISTVLGDDEHFYSYLGIAQLMPTAFSYAAFILIRGNLKKKTVLFWIPVILISIISPLLLGRRSSAASVVLYIFMYFVLKLRYKPYLLFSLLFLAIGLFYVYDVYENEIISALPILFDRIGDDTRSWTEDEFYKSFEGKVIDWIIGRGSLGTYYSNLWGHRTLIETGYLNLILHGGFLLLIPYVYILFVSAIRGFFLSRNKMVNAMSLYLFANIMLLYPGGHMDFSLRSFSIWICVFCCANSYYRRNKNFDLNL